MSWDLGKFKDMLENSSKQRDIDEDEYFKQNPPQKEITIVDVDGYLGETITVGFWFHENGVTTCRKMANGYRSQYFSHIPKEFVEIILEWCK